MLSIIKSLSSEIVRLSPDFNSSIDAPGSFSELIAASGDSVLTVSNIAESKTIFDDAGVNRCFRAWHDSIHIKHNYDFSWRGEYLTALKQIKQLKNPLHKLIVFVEVVGQKTFKEQKGYFVDNQVDFDLSLMKQIKGY